MDVRDIVSWPVYTVPDPDPAVLDPKLAILGTWKKSFKSGLRKSPGPPPEGSLDWPVDKVKERT